MMIVKTLSHYHTYIQIAQRKHAMPDETTQILRRLRFELIRKLERRPDTHQGYTYKNPVHECSS